MLADSPTGARNTPSAEYCPAHVDSEESRGTPVHGVPSIPEVTLESLMDAILPDVSSKLDKICRKAVSTKLIIDGNGKSRWKYLPRDPKSLNLDEPHAFRFMPEIFGGIRSLLSQSDSKKSLVKCVVNSDCTPFSERKNTSRPDGYITLSSPTVDGLKRVDWVDIVMPMGLKKKDDYSSQIDDFKMVAWSMHRAMRNNPTRRFVYGLTIENTTARLLFNDRCDVVASTPFDINKDWRFLVRIMLAVMQATRDELGYDPDIQVVPDRDPNLKRQYDITVRDRRDQGSTTTVYRTVDVLSDVGADRSCGPGTRVWRVQKLINGKPEGPHYALKDVWVHPDRLAEHELLTQIRDAQKDYGKHFLTVVAAGFVPSNASHPDELDDAWRVIRRGKALASTGKALRTYSWVKIPSSTSQSTSRETREEGRSSTGSSWSTVGYPSHVSALYERGHSGSDYLSRHSRRHYRIVFKEVGTPVRKIRNYASLIDAIEGACKGLYAIHLAGFVHRDVSVGNILFVQEEDPRGVIMDLGYTKKIDDDSDPHDVKVGTGAFMSVEVASTSYIIPRAPRQSLVKREPRERLPFRQSPLHDSESVWWVCMWMLFYLLPTGEHETPEHHSNFRQAFESLDARELFWRTERFDYLTEHFSAKPMLAIIMDVWRYNLQKAYAQSYAARNFWRIKPEVLQEVHLQELEMLGELRRATADNLGELRTLADSKPLPTPSRRSIGEASTHLPDAVIPHSIPAKQTFVQVSIPPSNPTKKRRRA